MFAGVVRPVLLIALALPCAMARGQGGGSSGSTYEPKPRDSRLGAAPGDGGNPLGDSPGAGEAVLQGRSGRNTRLIPNPAVIDKPAGTITESVVGPAHVPVAPTSPFGPLSLPISDDEGPADGLTLDQAIDRLVHRNLELRSKSFEIPQADADILTASLRANPILYTDVQAIPYGSFSPKRPGGQTQYDVNISYPLDVTRKRKARTLVACRAKRVVEAQFQDAIRLEIDNLYTEFVDVLAARETLREATEALRELGAEPTRRKGNAEDDLRLEVRRESAEIARDEADEELRVDLRNLGALLGMSPEEAEALQLRGSLHDNAPAPTGGAPLLRLTLASRPDLVAQRLGIGRAEADVGLALANRYPDLFLLYQPYTFQDDAPLGLKSAHSWGVGVGVPVPLFNRNQGNIRRARLNVTQTQVELASMEERAIMDVRQAERHYTVTREAVARIERSLLPRARDEHDRVTKLYLAGKAEELDFLRSESDFDLVVRQYRDTLVRHRRAMLRLNTAVGQRILP